MQMIKIAASRGLGLLALRRESAIRPVIKGARAAPLDSMKYWMDIAVLRISGSATSFIVDVTFGEDIGIKSAVTPSIIPNKVRLSIGILKVR